MHVPLKCYSRLWPLVLQSLTRQQSFFCHYVFVTLCCFEWFLILDCIQNKQLVVIVQLGSKFPKIEQTRGFLRMILTIKVSIVAFLIASFGQKVNFRVKLQIVTITKLRVLLGVPSIITGAPNTLMNGQNCRWLILNKKARSTPIVTTFFRIFLLIPLLPQLLPFCLLCFRLLRGHFHLHFLIHSPAWRLASFSYLLIVFFFDYCCRIDDFELRTASMKEWR